MQLHLLITADVLNFLNYTGVTVDQTHKRLTWQHDTIISDMHPCNRLGCNREKPSSHPLGKGFYWESRFRVLGAKLRFVFYKVMFGNALRRKCEAECPRRSRHSERMKCKKAVTKTRPSLPPFSHCFLCSRTCICVRAIACENQINTWKQPPPKKIKTKKTMAFACTYAQVVCVWGKLEGHS